MASRLPRTVSLYGVPLRVVDRPDFAVAHPDDCCPCPSGPPDICDDCLLAARPDTGEFVLLWQVGGINWSLSRETPEYERHLAEVQAMGGAR